MVAAWGKAKFHAAFEQKILPTFDARSRSVVPSQSHTNESQEGFSI